MRRPISFVFFIGCLFGALAGCQEKPGKARKAAKETQEQPEVQPPVVEVPAPAPAEQPVEAPVAEPATAPVTEAPANETPMPAAVPVAEERVTLSCDAAFPILGQQDEQHFTKAVEVSNLDQNKATEIVTHKGEIIELTSNLGTLTLSKRSGDAGAKYLATATMKAPLFALVDESSKVPATVSCSSGKTVAADLQARFACDAEILVQAEGASAPEKVTTRRETTFSEKDDGRSIELAELGSYRLVAYNDRGEITVAVEGEENWYGAAVGSLNDSIIESNISLAEATVKGRCERLP